MSPASPPSASDPDFSHAPGNRSPRGPEAREVERGIVNPFLLAAVWIGWQGFATLVWGGRPATAFALIAGGALAAFGLFPWLVHVHCLDCGRTLAVAARRRHRCPGEPRGRGRFLPIDLQIAFWWWGMFPLAFASLFVALVQLGSPR